MIKEKYKLIKFKNKIPPKIGCFFSDDGGGGVRLEQEIVKEKEIKKTLLKKIIKEKNKMKNILQKINKEIKKMSESLLEIGSQKFELKNIFYFVFIFSFVLFFSFFSNVNISQAVDTTPPTVKISHDPQLQSSCGAVQTCILDERPIKAGATRKIYASYSEAISGTPLVSIDQPGTADIVNAPMTKTPALVWDVSMTKTSTSYSTEYGPVTYANGIFLVKNGSFFLQSIDGMNWTPITTLPTTTYTWLDPIAANGRFFIFGYDRTNSPNNDVFLTSTDAVTWTLNSFPFLINKEYSQYPAISITYGNNLYVVLMKYLNNVTNGINSAIMTSPDGITWTSRSTTTNGDWTSIAYGNGVFVAVANNISGTYNFNSKALTSPNGTTWTEVSLGASYTTMRGLDVEFGNGVFSLVNSQYAFTSTNGAVWTKGPGYFGCMSVVYADGYFVCATYNNMYISQDAINWNSIGNLDSSILGGAWDSLTYGNGIFVSKSGYSQDPTDANGSWGNIKRIITSSINNYIYTYTAVQNNGSTYVDGVANVSLSSVTDLAGNPSLVPTGHNTFSIDTIPPTVSMSSTTPSPITGAFNATVAFSEPVLLYPYYPISMVITTTGITPSLTTTIPYVNFSQQALSNYDFLMTPYATGTITADIPTTAATDLAGNPNSILVPSFTRTAQASPPTISTPTSSTIAATSAVLGATVLTLGIPTTITRGVCVGTTINPTTNCVAEGYSSVGAYTQTITGLISNTLYYFRGYATNTAGTVYTTNGTFTTLTSVPTVTTPTVSNISTTTVTLGANVTLLGGPAVISSRGTCWGTTTNPTTNCVAEGGTTTGVFTHSRTGLSQNTTYYYRGYATNATGTGYSTSGTFTTLAVNAPTVSTPTVTSIGATFATLGANVTSLGGPAVISARGTCWGTTPSPTTNCTAEGGTTTGVFTHSRTGLSQNTTYYYRGYATNTSGTGYSADGTFSTLSPPIVTSPTSSIISTKSATLGANVTSLGIPASISSRGVCWGTTPNPSVDCKGTLIIDTTIKSLVVGGGGGGGGSMGGGGGAGGVRYTEGSQLSAQSYSVTVGTGGAGGSGSAKGGNGVNSSFNGIIATGGGGGGYYTGSANPGNAGGSGGGAGAYASGTGGLGTVGQGNNGGASISAYTGAGGGGAGAIGYSSSASLPGNGGIGIQNSISGSSVYYAGGGGGGGYSVTCGTSSSTGGLGGGGAGKCSGNAIAGTANTGGGGGGAGYSAGVGGAGGSGVVIISYLTASGIVATGGTITTVGGNKIHTFTTNGTFTITYLPSALTSGVFTYPVTELIPNTLYYYRGFAINSSGTAYSPDGSFSTIPFQASLAYTKNPTGPGVQTITATYPESIIGTPTISINQQGTTDILNASMVNINGITWTGRLAAEANAWQSITYGNGLFVAIATSGTNRVMTSLDGITWTARAAAQANSWMSVTYGNGLFVAVSSNGTNRVMTSPDGITWTARTAAQASTWMSVTYGNGLFVALGAGISQAMTSPDGITWTLRTVPGTNQWRSLIYANSLFVAVSVDGTNRVMTSPDGITWTAGNATEANQWYSVTYGNGLFVAVSGDGINKVMTSPDGITWTPRTAAQANTWNSITYGNGLFVAVATSGTNRVMTSSDGITWTGRLAAEANTWTSVTYGNDLFVAVVNIGTNRVMTSPATSYSYDYTVNISNGSNYIDGITTVSLSSVTDLIGNSSSGPTNNTFVIKATPPAVALTYTKKIIGTGVQKITATYSDAVTNTPLISINQQGTADISNVSMTNISPISGTGGSIWTGRTAMELNPWSSVTYGNGLFVAASGGGANRVATSPDGITWTYQGPILYGLRSVTYGNGLFVAVASFTGAVQPNVMTSPDGIIWTSYTILSSAYWHSVTYGNGLFVAVAWTNTDSVMTSPDGITWTVRSAPQANNWNSVTYANGLFVAVSSDGTNRVMTSSDGITWTARTATEANSWSSVTYGNGLFVAVAGSGTNRVMTSPDGITWTPRTAAEANYWNSITYGNGLFVAVAVNGTNRVMTSLNGITWTSRTAAVVNSWQSVTYGNGLFVAVANVTGTANLIMTSSAYSNLFSYDYTVNMADGSNYKDGVATVTTSSVADILGNVASAPTNNTFTINTTGPGVVLSYSSNPAGTGVLKITATYANDVLGSPTISINQPGTADVLNASMSGSGNIRTYYYTINKANGSTYVDGTATITLSPLVDLTGNPTNTPTNNTFVINTTSTLNAALTYSSNPVSVGTQIITVTYSADIVGTPKISIDQPGSIDIVNTTMSGSGRVWTYSYTVHPTDGINYIYGNAIVGLSNVTDLAGNPPNGPTNNTFVLNTAGPTVSLTYTANPINSGTQKITAVYSKPIVGTPTISINQPGTNDITNVLMSSSQNALTWTSRVTPNNYWYSIAYGNGTFVAIAYDGANEVMTSTDGITWAARNASEVNFWMAVAYGNGKFVAVSANGDNVMTSPDGITWTSSPIGLGSSDWWNSITYGDGLFVAVATTNANKIMTSPDGITWTARTVGEKDNMWNSITYGNGLFVAVGNLGGMGTHPIMTSPDGINWTLRNSSGSFNSVTYGNGLFVAFGDSIMTSTDGITWITQTAPFSGWVASTYGNGTFVAVSSTGNVVTSENGTTWTTRTNMAGAWRAMTYGNGLYVAVAEGGTNAIMTSPSGGYTYNYVINTSNGSTYVDGVTTVTLSNVTDLDGNISNNPTNNTFTIDTNPTSGLAVALSYTKNSVASGETQRISAKYSKAITGVPNISIDQQGAIDIANIPMNPLASVWQGQTSVETNAWTSITYGNGLFVAVAVEGKVMTSLDGVIWTERTPSESNTWTSVTYGNGIFVAVSQNGRAMTSINGINWTARTPVNFFQWNSVTYGGGLFVAVASNGTNRVMTSPDGITWTERITTESNTWTSVTYGNNTFVAVSYDGTKRVMTSPDGITWTEITAGTSNTWTSVAYGNDLFVAVADDGGVMTSVDGVTWIARTASALNAWKSVIYSSNTFVAVASSGTNRVMTSADGITWTGRSSSSSNAWQSVTYGNGQLVAVASNGTSQVMTSPDNYYYDYLVMPADGVDYIDGLVTVSLSTVTDLLGTSSSAPTNNTFLIQNGFSPKGELTSSVFDTTSTSSNIKYNSIMWKGTLGDESASEGKVRFQLATSATPDGTWNYYGGDTCSAFDWFDPQGPDKPIELNGVNCTNNWNGNRYFRYKVQICSANDCSSLGMSTPVINSVIVNWSP